eukprot:8430186-Pyramimonas_sp.AAC.1
MVSSLSPISKTTQQTCAAGGAVPRRARAPRRTRACGLEGEKGAVQCAVARSARAVLRRAPSLP